MRDEELQEYLDEYRDSNSRQNLIQALKDRVIGEMEEMDVSSSVQKHDLTMIIRDFEEELDWIENNKLSEFDPEHE